MRRSEWQRLRLPVNGITLHVVAAGPKDGPPVILLHGFPEFWLAWCHQIEALAGAGLRVIVPDQRGYNLSDKPTGIGAYTIETLVADVVALADAIGRRQFAVVGHDWGAAIAWELAARHPERVSRAAMLNAPHPAVLRQYLLRHPTQLAKSWYIGFFQLPGIPEAVLRAGHFGLLARSMRRSAQPGTFSRTDLARYRDAWEQPGALTAMLNWYRALRRYGMTMPAPRIRVPVRVIWGDRDAFLEPGLADASAALCDAADVVHLPEATHWAQHEAAFEVNRLLVEFLGAPQEIIQRQPVSLV
jgi:pimeloyl-ACP methyl ester carboxylesterase